MKRRSFIRLYLDQIQIRMKETFKVFQTKSTNSGCLEHSAILIEGFTIMKAKRTTWLILIWLMFSVSGKAMACMNSSKGSRSGVRSLIEDSVGIYLVTLQSAIAVEPVLLTQTHPALSLKDVIENVRVESTRRVIYSFDVLEPIKGAKLTRLEIEIPLRNIEDLFDDFNGHKSDIFWNDPSAGRARINSDCSISTTFTFGHQYIILISDNPTIKSYERIKSEEDRFLQFVRTSSAAK